MDDRSTRPLGQAAMVLFLLLGAALSRQPGATVVVGTAVGLVATALMPRSGWPVLAGALVAGAGVTAVCSGNGADVGWFAGAVLAGWCVLAAGTGPTAVFTAASVAVLAVQAYRFPDTGWAAWVAGTVFTVVVCRLSARQAELVDQLRSAQVGLAERVREQERTRVAGELHDVIAHSLTVSLLHIGAARLALAEDPASAVSALERAEELSRRSLGEVRHAVGLLHDGPGPAAPLPGTPQLPALVDGFRRAGAPVAYDVVGDPSELPGTTGLTVYRILQESLTNAVRHGSGSGTQVRLEVRADAAVLTVDSAGPPVAGDGAGVGLRSMRERAEALGGRFSAGPTGGGWRVHVVLPS